MSSNVLNSKIETRNRNLNSMATLVSKNQQDSDAYRALERAVNEADEDISMLRKLEAMMEKSNIAVQSQRTADAVASTVRNVLPSTISALMPYQGENVEERKAKLNAEFRNYLRNGDVKELRDITVSNSGAVVPQEFESAYVSALKFYGPLASIVKVRNSDDSGRASKFTVSDDTASKMKYIAEGSDSTSSAADPTLVSTIPSTDALVTTVKYSLEMLEDAFSLDSFIRDIAGLRVARAVEHALTTGQDQDGVALPNQFTGGLLASVPTGATTSTLAAGVKYLDFVALFTSLDAAYVAPGKGAFMVSPTTYNYLLTQVTTDNRPFWSFDGTTGLLTILGLPVYKNNAMGSYNTASTQAVLCGDFSSAYAYLNGGGIKIKVLNERYIDTHEGAAVIYHRLGGAKLVSGAVKALVTAAS
jgi:HK97 family phage major capsid protein